MNSIIKNLPLLCLLFMLSTNNVAVALPPAVTVSAQHYGGLIVYNYRLINNSLYAISSVQIGYDVSKAQTPNNYGYELLSYPSGTVGQGIPLASVTSPALWEALFIEPEETPEGSIEWSVIDANSPRLAAGQALAGMSIKLDKMDHSYLASHATISFSNSVTPRISVLIQRLDTTPPALTITPTPASTTLAQRGQLVPINVTIATKDNYDPAPEIKLVSITANEVLAPSDIQGAAIGTDDRSFSLKAARTNPAMVRTYTLTYSATDASGNTSTASVALPVN